MTSKVYRVLAKPLPHPDDEEPQFKPSEKDARRILGAARKAGREPTEQ